MNLEARERRPSQDTISTFTWTVTCVSTHHSKNKMLKSVKSKGKVAPVLKQAPCHEGVLGKWRYSSTHYLTSALNGGEWSDLHKRCDLNMLSTLNYNIHYFGLTLIYLSNSPPSCKESLSNGT